MAFATHIDNGAVASASGAVTANAGTRAVDDVLVLIVETANQQVGNNPPTGYTQVTDSPQGVGTGGDAAATRCSVFWRRATNDGSDSAALGDSGDHQYAIIAGFTGVSTDANPFDITAGSNDGT